MSVSENWHHATYIQILDETSKWEKLPGQVTRRSLAPTPSGVYPGSDSKRLIGQLVFGTRRECQRVPRNANRSSPRRQGIPAALAAYYLVDADHCLSAREVGLRESSMYTVKQVAERLNISVRTIYAAVERGDLKCHRFGQRRGTIRVSEENLRAYLEQSVSQAESSLPKLPTQFKHLRF